MNLTHKTDHELMELGSNESFDMLMKRHNASLINHLCYKGATIEDAQDVAQETFLRVWTKRDKYNPNRAEFKTFLFTIAMRLLSNLFRNNQRKGMTSNTATNNEGEEISLLDTQASPLPTPDQSIIESEIKIAIQNAISTLPADQQEAITMALIEGKSMKEIAEAQNTTTGNITSKIRRIKIKLQALLEEYV